MEWVETTGRTLEEAKDAALDQLGVDEHDAEFEVLDEGKIGLFGRVRTEARVRARVRPTRPRAKDEGRDRRRRGQGRRNGRNGGERPEGQEAAGQPTASASSGERSGGRSRGRGGRGPRTETEPARQETESGGTDVEVSLEEQAEEAKAFLQGLVEHFDRSAEVSVAEVDEDTAELRVAGGDLGLLIGPKGQTLSAIQELTRTAVQRRPGGGRLLVDVGGYRQKRRVALEAFTRQQVERALSTGTRLVLEPMSPADRKVVHDTAATIDTVDALRDIKADDKSSFFRLTKTRPSGPSIVPSLNDAMVFSYYGTPSYGSFNNINYINFLVAVDQIPPNSERETRWSVGLLDNFLLSLFAGEKYALVDDSQG